MLESIQDRRTECNFRRMIVKEMDLKALQQDPDAVIAAVARQVQTEPDRVRVKFGRRIVFGQLARGEVRRELTADRVGTLLDAIRQPTEPTIAPNDRAVPAIAIEADGRTVFRQERDGAVSANELQDLAIALGLEPVELIAPPIVPVADLLEPPTAAPTDAIADEPEIDGQADQGLEEEFDAPEGDLPLFFDAESADRAVEEPLPEDLPIDALDGVFDRVEWQPSAGDERRLSEAAPPNGVELPPSAWHRDRASQSFPAPFADWVIDEPPPRDLAMDDCDRAIVVSPGGVTVEPAADARAAISTVEADAPPPAASASPWQVEAMLAAADYWLRPLGPSGPNYEEVALAGYRIAMVPEAGPGAIAIQRGQQPLVQRAADGEWRSRATVDDWQRFEALLGRGFGDVPAVAVRLDGDPIAVAGATQQQLDALPPSDSVRWLKQALQDFGRSAYQTLQSLGDKPRQFVASVREAVQPAAAAATQRATDLKTWLQTQAATGVAEGRQFLKSVSQAIAQQSMARTALSLYEKGFARTRENVYRADGYRIERRGNLFSLLPDRDEPNLRPLLQFSARSSPLGGQSIKIVAPEVTSVAWEDLSRLAAVDRGDRPPVGSPAAEVQYVQQAARAGQLAKSLLDRAGAATLDGDRFWLRSIAGNGVEVVEKASDRRLLWTPEAGCTSTLPRSACRTLQRTVATVLQNAARATTTATGRRPDGLAL
jgi:hypothetical protein